MPIGFYLQEDVDEKVTTAHDDKNPVTHIASRGPVHEFYNSNGNHPVVGIKNKCEAKRMKKVQKKIPYDQVAKVVIVYTEK